VYQELAKRFKLLYSVLVLIGAISNLYDRLSYSYVIDYLDLKYFTVFNVADAMIVLPVFSILLFQYTCEPKKIKPHFLGWGAGVFWFCLSPVEADGESLLCLLMIFLRGMRPRSR
jgi:hypothetical protein